MVGLALVWGSARAEAAKAAADAGEKSAAHAEKTGDANGAGHDAGHHIGHANATKELENAAEFRSDLAIWTLVVFLLLMAILWKFAWGPIAAALEKREQSIAEHIASAQRSHEEAKALLAQYERKLAQAADEVRGMLEEARRDSEHTRQEIVAQARTEAQAEAARGRREIETATAAALKELAQSSANLAVDLAGKILRAKLNPTDHAQLIKQAMADLPAGSASRN